MARGKPKKKGHKKGKGVREDAVPEKESSAFNYFSSKAGISSITVAVVAALVLAYREYTTTASVNELSTPQDNITLSDVTLAAFHSLDNVDRQNLLEYMRFDDGYTACLTQGDLTEDTFGVWQLKKLKFQYLEIIASSRPHWLVESDLTRSATCRVLTLTHQEYDAVDQFKSVMKQNKTTPILAFSLGVQNNASELRTIVCLSRLLDTLVNRDEVYVTPELDKIRYDWVMEGSKYKEDAEAEEPLPLVEGWKDLFKEDHSPFSYYQKQGTQYTTWIRPTVRPGETGHPPKHSEEKKASLVVRKVPCPLEDSAVLLF